MDSRIAALAIVLLLASPLASAQQSGNDGTSYISGGIGADEVQRILAREKEYALKLVFTLVEGNYVSDVRVVLKKPGGAALLTFDAQGPVALINAPPGSYRVEADYEGKVQARNVRISPRLRTEYFRWRSNPDTDFTVRD